MKHRSVQASAGHENGDGIEEAGASRGQTIVRPFGKDSSSVDLPNTRGKEMGGGLTDLSHSLSGASVAKAPSRGR